MNDSKLMLKINRNNTTILALTLYLIALLIVLSWFVLTSFNFEELTRFGFKNSPVNQLPEFFRPLYQKFPNSMTLLCYFIFTFSAFLFLKEKKKVLKCISISSFVMIFLILWLLK